MIYFNQHTPVEVRLWVVVYNHIGYAISIHTPVWVRHINGYSLFVLFRSMHRRGAVLDNVASRFSVLI